jgi:hypothetical protein
MVLSVDGDVLVSCRYGPLSGVAMHDGIVFAMDDRGQRAARRVGCRRAVMYGGCCVTVMYGYRSLASYQLDERACERHRQPSDASDCQCCRQGPHFSTMASGSSRCSPWLPAPGLLSVTVCCVWWLQHTTRAAARHMGERGSRGPCRPVQCGCAGCSRCVRWRRAPTCDCRVANQVLHHAVHPACVWLRCWATHCAA